MARPRLPISRRKSKQVSFYVTEAVYQKLADDAGRVSMSPNELARELMLSGHNRLVLKTHAFSDPALLKRVEHIACILQPLVKQCYTFKEIDPELTQLCKSLQKLIDKNLESISQR